MKRKLLLASLLIVSLFICSCSCDKFDLNTYTSAVKNYNNSTGISYKLTVVTTEEDNSIELLEESNNEYILSTTRQVLQYSSELKKYEVVINKYGANSAPQKVYELNRYFKSNIGTFYTNVRTQNNDSRNMESTTYENKYDSTSEYNINNIVPTFSKEDISDFSIDKIEDKNGFSSATFKAACPIYLTCSEEKIVYNVTINKDFYFNKIEFITINDKITKKYTYDFLNYNSDVEIIFPDDLSNY